MNFIKRTALNILYKVPYLIIQNAKFKFITIDQVHYFLFLKQNLRKYDPTSKNHFYQFIKSDFIEIQVLHRTEEQVSQIEKQWTSATLI